MFSVNTKSGHLTCKVNQEGVKWYQLFLYALNDFLRCINQNLYSHRATTEEPIKVKKSGSKLTVAKLEKNGWCQ